MSIDYLTADDWNRSYELPDHVITNIPRCGGIGGYGAHRHARGLLVEVCRYTGSAPVTLHYNETEILGGGALLVITATATRPDGEPLMVTTHLRQRPVDNLDGDWSITVNGRRYPDEDRRFPPSLPYQGALVRWLLNSRLAPGAQL